MNYVINGFVVGCLWILVIMSININGNLDSINHNLHEINLTLIKK